MQQTVNLSTYVFEGSNPSLPKLCFAKFGIEAALSNATKRSIAAAEIPKNLVTKIRDEGPFQSITMRA